MKKGVWVLVIWFIAIGGSVRADDPTIWHSGELVLNTGREISGELSFNWKAEVVQYRQGAIIKAYSANQVYSFRYYDDQQSMIRRFVAVDYPGKAGRQHPRILEEVVSGSLPVYRELRSVRELIKVMTLVNYGTDEELAGDIDNFTYMVSSKGELIPLETFYRKVWPQVRTAFEVDFKRYAMNSHVEMAHTLELLQLIRMYNSLVEKTTNPSPAESAVLSAGH